MSTKNLARTVTEGKHSGKEDRHYCRSETRADERAYIREVEMDVENYYDYDIPQTRSSYGYCAYKWGPINRWLTSHCGQPWSEVRSEAANTFGSLTKGQYGPYERLLRSVEEVPDLSCYRGMSRPDDWTQSYRRHEYYVDNDGILREKTVIQNDRRSQKVPAFDTKQIANWLSGRVVGKVGNKYFWFIPSDKNKKRGGQDRTWRTDWSTQSYYNSLKFLYLAEQPIYKKDFVGRNVLENGAFVVIGHESVWKTGRPNSLRQGRKLTNKELNYWSSIPEYYQTKVLELSPTYPNPPKPDYNSFY
jgi:hypothetical protein